MSMTVVEGRHKITTAVFKGHEYDINELELYVDGQKIDPKVSQAVVNHSPDGFAVGYEGSGPAQAALGILIKVLGQKKALWMYQDFKREYLAKLPTDQDFSFRLDIQDWADAKMADFFEQDLTASDTI